MAKTDKLNLLNYVSLIGNKNFKKGVILDSIIDANNTGAIYRSAKEFDIDFIINSTKHAIIENSALLISACGHSKLLILLSQIIFQMLLKNLF